MEFDTEQYLKTLNNDQLIDALNKAAQDLEIAAEKEKDSEWHQACFAGLMTYALEADKRGLRAAKLH